MLSVFFHSQLFVASSPPCGFPSGLITRGAWCPSASLCIRAGWALHFVCWEAVWSPAVQWTPLLHTLTTIDSTTPNRAPLFPAPPPLTTPKVLTCELRDCCSDLISTLFLLSLSFQCFLFQQCLYLQWWLFGELSYSWTLTFWHGSRVSHPNVT